jgi:hypothetical protein
MAQNSSAGVFIAHLPGVTWLRMASDITAAAIERDLKLRALHGATLAELVNHLDEENRRLGGSRLSSEQSEELHLSCWALHKRASLARRLDGESVWGALEYDHIDG